MATCKVRFQHTWPAGRYCPHMAISNVRVQYTWPACHYCPTWLPVRWEFYTPGQLRWEFYTPGQQAVTVPTWPSVMWEFNIPGQQSATVPTWPPVILVRIQHTWPAGHYCPHMATGENQHTWPAGCYCPTWPPVRWEFNTPGQQTVNVPTWPSVRWEFNTHLASRPLLSPDDIRFFTGPWCGDRPRWGSCCECDIEVLADVGDGGQLGEVIGDCRPPGIPLRDVDFIFGLKGSAVFWTAHQTPQQMQSTYQTYSQFSHHDVFSEISHFCDKCCYNFIIFHDFNGFLSLLMHVWTSARQYVLCSVAIVSSVRSGHAPSCQ